MERDAELYGSLLLVNGNGKELLIPAGYTTKDDFTGDCYECVFNNETGEGEDSEIECTHPHASKVGCADYDVVFVKS
jgi:hypothetical protein